MKNFFRRKNFDVQPLNRFFNNVLTWTKGFVRWTEEEQTDAGIYIGDYSEQRD